jgi:translation elongation factor EF-Tu-like GTPase
MAINSPEWNLVRASLGADKRELFEKVTVEVTDETGHAEHVSSFQPVAAGGNQSALEAFARIETDVERLVQEVTSLQLAERELRTALEEPSGAETQRRF